MESEIEQGHPALRSRVIPYAYAPMFTDSELERLEAGTREETQPSTSSENLAESVARFPAAGANSAPELTVENFCQCGKCVIMPKHEENVCCDFKNTTTFSCVTEDPEFQGSVLCKSTLELIAMQEEHREQESRVDFTGEFKQERSINLLWFAYANLLLFLSLSLVKIFEWKTRNTGSGHIDKHGGIFTEPQWGKEFESPIHRVWLLQFWRSSLFVKVKPGLGFVSALSSAVIKVQEWMVPKKNPEDMLRMGNNIDDHGGKKS